MFDISTLAVEETTDITLINPGTGEPLLGDGGKACTVTVYGPGSRTFAAAQSAASARLIKRLQAKGRAATPTPEEDEGARAAFLTAITKSLNGFSYGKDLEPAQAIRALYEDRAMGWVTEQVNTGAGDWSNFTKTSSTS